MSILCLATCLLLAGGCSRFEKNWKQAGQQDFPESEMAGRWTGTWTSDADGHSGSLRCLITDLNGGAYRAAFRSTYGNVFRFDHTVTLYAVNLRGMWTFEGSENLGLLAGGVFNYKGKAGPNKFFSTYKSRNDEGSFEMYRVKKDDPPKEEKKKGFKLW
ncbi:MAG: hypothetical protein DHS20C16_17640 [Phycisphaerae bacterium]|nr:MAG: hypothetical protein DHS20C16_17640 [Phycisphaerae bacterium]